MPLRITILVLLCFNLLKSQTFTNKELRDGLTGNWRFVYKNQLLKPDTECIFKKIILSLKGNKGSESGLFKTGEVIKSAISWSKIPPDKSGKSSILFKGGLWVNNQDFEIKEITKDKITMLSCDNYEICDEAYLIRE